MIDKIQSKSVRHSLFYLTVFLLSITFSACRSLSINHKNSGSNATAAEAAAEKFSKKISGLAGQRVAVIDFPGINGSPSEFGNLFAERLTDR